MNKYDLLFEELEGNDLLHEELPKEKDFILKHIGQDNIDDYKMLISEGELYDFYMYLEILIRYDNDSGKENEPNDIVYDAGFDGASVEYYNLNGIKVFFGGWGCYYFIMKKDDFVQFYDKWQESLRDEKDTNAPANS